MTVVNLGATYSFVPSNSWVAVGWRRPTARDGRPVYVRDVADVVLATSPAENRVSAIRKTADAGLERAPAVSLAIAKRPGTNAVVIADEIVRRLE